MALCMCAGERVPCLQSPMCNFASCVASWKVHIPYLKISNSKYRLSQLSTAPSSLFTLLPWHLCLSSSDPECSHYPSPLLEPPHPQSPPSLPPLSSLWCHSSCYPVSAPSLVGSDLLISTSHFPNLLQGFGKGLLILFYSLPAPMSMMVTYTSSDFMILLIDSIV